MKPLAGLILFSLALLAMDARSDCPKADEADPDLSANLVRYSVPPLTCASLRKKFAYLNAKHPTPTPAFSFFRTAVPWYWDFLRRDRTCQSSPTGSFVPTEIGKVFRDFKGFCSGDPHPENFAIQYLPAPAKPTFGVNDPDDAGKSCPVLGDFMRFLVAAKLASAKPGIPPLDLDRLVSKYVAALGKPAVPNSPYFRALSEKDPKEAGTDLPKGAACSPETFVKLRAEYAKLRAQKGIKFDPEPQLTDCVDESGSKESGGSGGLPRYTIRFSEMKGKAPATPVAVLFKGTQKNATAFYDDPRGSAPWAAKERYAKACAFERGPKAPVCPVVSDDTGNSYQVRVKTERAVNLDKVAPADFQGILEDEAGTLGNLHRSHLAEPKKLGEYMRRVAGLKDSIVESSAALARLTEKTADGLKKALEPNGDFDRTCAANSPTEKTVSGEKRSAEKSSAEVDAN